jgi:hypothetical protein
LQCAIRSIAEYNLSAYDQELKADLCQWLLLLLQFVSVLCVVLKVSDGIGADENDEDWRTKIREGGLIVLEVIISATPIVSGILAAGISKARFSEDAHALRYAADALESELWRYRTRTGDYRRDESSSSDPSRWAQEALEKYGEKRAEIKAASTVKQFHACGSLLHIGRDNSDYEYMRRWLWPIVEHDHDQDHDQDHCDPVRPTFLNLFLKEKVSPFTFLWELCFEFLMFNERDRIDPPGATFSIVTVVIATAASVAVLLIYHAEVWLLCLPVGFGLALCILLCTCRQELPRGYATSLVPRIVTWLLYMLLWTALFPLHLLTTAFGCPGVSQYVAIGLLSHVSNAPDSTEEFELPEELDQKEKQVSADLYFKSRCKAVENHISIEKTRLSHQQSVSLLLQTTLSLLALHQSDPGEVVQDLQSVWAAESWLPPSTVHTEPAPLAFCVSKSEAIPSDAMSVAQHVRDTNDMCTQVMRYARCEQPPYAALGCIQLARETSDETESVIPACAQCAEREPYNTWERHTHDDHSGEMMQLCTGGQRVRQCRYEMVPTADDPVFQSFAADASGCENTELPSAWGDIWVAVYTALMSLVIGLQSYFRFDQRLSSLEHSRSKLESARDEWRTYSRYDADHLEHKDDLVDNTERAFLERYDPIPAGPTTSSAPPASAASAGAHGGLSQADIPYRQLEPQADIP